MRLRAGTAAFALALATLVVALASGLAPATAQAQTVTAAGRSAQAQPPIVTPIEVPPPLAPPAQSPSVDPAADLGELLGKPIARVAVALEGNVWDDVEVPPVRSVRPGDPLTPAVARRALAEVLGTGAFARGRVSVSAEGGGALLVVRVVPRKLITRVRLDLHGARLDREELLAAGDLAEGGELVSADLADRAAHLARYCGQHGYPEARATLETRGTEDPRRALVLVDVVPGAPRVIDQRVFYVYGAGVSGPVLLEHAPDGVDATTGSYGARPGDRADDSALTSADLALEQALHVAGWPRAKVSHDLVSTVASGERPRVVLRVRVETGAQQVAQFEGNEHYDDATLSIALGLDKETDRSPSHLADKLHAFYEKRGFLDVVVRPELRGAETDPVQVLLFHVTEHARVHVASRRYPCVKLDAVRRLSNGGPRSPSEIGTEIESYLEEELPGAELFVDPDPRGVSETFATGGANGGQGMPSGTRAEPVDLRPETTFAPETYDRAVEHVQELYRNEGFLHAQVGPVQVLRARCDPRSPAGRCLPLPLPPMPPEVCTYDTSGLPLPAAPLDPAMTCRADPAHGVECADAVQVIVPVKLGPRTQLWDIAFAGLHAVSERDAAEAAQVPVGEFVSTTKLDDARRRIVDWYKEQGYPYVDVKYALEPSLDNTRARVRFDVVEGDQVVVSDIVIRGLVETREGVVRRRIALTVGQPYRTSDVRKTQERIATLGVFSSIQIGLGDPFVPGPRKVVYIDVVENLPQYVEPRIGFSTGEGVRGALEYGHRNLFGFAWSVVFHIQGAYLPDFLILDPQVAANYRTLSTANRLATRDTVTFAWPEMGLGPTVRSQLDGVYVRDLERDFTLVKAAAVGTMTWRPVRQVQVSGGPDYENNVVHLFQGGTIASYLNEPQNQGTQLGRLLRVPDGESNVIAAKVTATLDQRDAPFNAHRGTYLAAGVEQVNSFPVQTPGVDPTQQFEGHFLRLTQTLAAYVPITKTISFAAEMRLGEIVNTSVCSSLQSTTKSGTTLAAPSYCTYPDRQFYMGGFDSMRGWLQDAFIPQELVNQIDAGKLSCSSQSNCQVPLRGGNFMVNPRFELRFPLRSPVDAAVFTDIGNLWNDPADVFQGGFVLRADVGFGLRVQTPVGPLVFDYGFNVTRKSYEDLGAFHFAIGLF